ncbi:hypothetical protein [Ehrlichia ruminantium]|uniref:hypothetical protein n=1 Tax=Ehrlichia ruminantium TaxID=779 RepID=UPI00130DBB12|nr:hypothetical protein [Ehrlichia ruminantium]
MVMIQPRELPRVQQITLANVVVAQIVMVLVYILSSKKEGVSLLRNNVIRLLLV